MQYNKTKLQACSLERHVVNISLHLCMGRYFIRYRKKEYFCGDYGHANWFRKTYFTV